MIMYCDVQNPVSGSRKFLCQTQHGLMMLYVLVRVCFIIVGHIAQFANSTGIALAGQLRQSG